MSYRKEPANEKTHRKEEASQPAAKVVAELPLSDGGLAQLLTQVWQHLPGGPGATLLARIAETLGAAPIAEFRELLISRRTKARSFGLALELARETRKRWDAEAHAHKQAVEAELQDKIRRAEALIADGQTPREELPDLERYLSELRQQIDTTQETQARRKPKSETKPPAERRRSA